MYPTVRAEREGDHSFITSWLGPDAVVVDLGMNRGLFAETVHKRFGCQVLGVEPDPELAAGNRARGLDCLHAAIAPESGIVAFHVDGNDRTASRILPQGGPNTIDVPALPLGQFLGERAINRAALLKVDIEGAELALFKQEPREVFDRFEQITVEFHAFLQPAQRPQVMEILATMTERGFMCIDFSLVLMDVLLINTRVRPLSLFDRQAIIAAKYLNGARRRWEAWRSRQIRP